MREHYFEDAEDIPSLVYELIGAASVCWHDDGMFDEEHARRLGGDALDKLAYLMYESTRKKGFNA